MERRSDWSELICEGESVVGEGVCGCEGGRRCSEEDDVRNGNDDEEEGEGEGEGCGREGGRGEGGGRTMKDAPDGSTK